MGNQGTLCGLRLRCGPIAALEDMFAPEGFPQFLCLDKIQGAKNQPSKLR
jgi:hypothetical protein